jgi:hypothetical protein
MASTYTTNKVIEKPASGDYANAWAAPVNTDWDIIDQAFGTTTSLNATAGSVTLTAAQYRSLSLSISGAVSANVTYTIPSLVGGQWIVYNTTTDVSGGPYTVTIASASGGTSVVISRNKATIIVSDGGNPVTNIRSVYAESLATAIVTSVTATAPLTSTGGTTPIIALTTPVTAAFGGTGLSAVGTAGNLLTSNGTAWVSSAPAATSPIPTIQAFTSSGTFTVPAGVTKVKVTVVGGGAGGRTATNSTSQGGGGSGGASIKVITGLTPAGTVAVTVGTGGAANTDGVTSSFGAYCSATGGSSPAFGGPGQGGAGGTATGGDINFTGGAGCGGNGVNGTVSGTAGNGGSSIFGGAGLGAPSTNSANTAGAGAPGTGGGGGGGCGGPGTGGAGGSGIVIVEY